MKEACKICGAATKAFYDPRLAINFYKCEVCQFICKEYSAIVSSEEEKEEYDLHNNSYEDKRYVNRFKDFLNKTVFQFTDQQSNRPCNQQYTYSDHVNDSGKFGVSKKALDFGSGPEPVLAKVLSIDYGYEVDIYDLYYSPEKVYAGKKYDLVTCTEVVEHLENPMEYFRLFKSLIKKDGVLAIMTEFHPVEVESFCNWYYRREKTHISFFTPATMHCIAEIVGLKLLYIDEKNACSFTLK